MIIRMPFPSHQHVNPPKAVSDAGLRNLPHPAPRQSIVCGRTRNTIPTDSVKPPHSFFAPTPGNDPEVLRPTLCAESALKLFFQNILKHLFVKAQIGYELFELMIFFFRLPQPSRFRNAQASVFLFPIEKGRLTDAHFAAYFRNLDPDFGLFQGKGDLLFGEF